MRELAGGKAIVTDQADRSVFLVDFGANTSTRVGRQGDGPNEYRFPSLPMRGAGDTTLVVDLTARRTLVIGLTGAIVATLSTPSAGIAGGLVAPHGTDRLGRAYFEGNSFDPERGSFTDSVAMVRWTLRDNKVEVLGRISTGGRVRFDMGGMAASMARSVTPFPHLDAWAVLPDGALAIVRQSPFRVDRLGADGTLRAGTPIPHAAIPVTSAERQAWRDRDPSRRISASGRGGGTGQAMQRPPMPDEVFPKEMPAFIANAVLSTPEGELWVGRSHAGTDTRWSYDILDSSGVPRGSAVLSANSVVVGFGNGVVYVARTDPADDLVYLERYRR